MDRAHVLFCGAVCLEAAACFAVPVFFLSLGLLYLPLLLAGAIRTLTTDAVYYLPIAITVLGSAGIAGVVRVLVLLCRRRQQDPWRWLTLAALACGIATALLYASIASNHRVTPSFETWLTMVHLPLACTAHLVYMARRPLFT